MADGNKSGAVRDRTTGASSSHEVTHLLRAWKGGDEDALAASYPGSCIRSYGVSPSDTCRASVLATPCRRPHSSMKPTCGSGYLQEVNWQDRSHFFAICARLMRRILIDLARSKLYQKRGAGKTCICLDEGRATGPQPPADIVALDEALKALAALDPRKEQVVELRFFGGLSVKETARVLRVSNETVMRDWRLAKTWLWRELRQENSHGA